MMGRNMKRNHHQENFCWLPRGRVAVLLLAAFLLSSIQLFPLVINIVNIIINVVNIIINIAPMIINIVIIIVNIIINIVNIIINIVIKIVNIIINIVNIIINIDINTANIIIIPVIPIVVIYFLCPDIDVGALTLNTLKELFKITMTMTRPVHVCL